MQREEKKNDKMDQKCAKYKKYLFSSLPKKLQNSKNSSFLFSFLQQKKCFFSLQFCAITKCIHNVLYTLHGLVFAIKKQKLLQRGSFNQRGKNFKRVVRKQKSKSGKNVINGQKIFFCGLEVKILFRCPAEKELFTMEGKKVRKKRKRKKTQFSIYCVWYKFSNLLKYVRI